MQIGNTFTATIEDNQIDPFARSSRLERSPQSRGRSSSVVTTREIKKITSTASRSTSSKQQIKKLNEAAMAQINNELFQENSTRTQNEQVLFLAWKASQQEKNSLNDKVSQLQEQLVTLQNKYIELEK